MAAVPLRGDAGETNPVPVVATQLPLFEEKEPNDTPKEATRIALPCGVNGRIGAKRDLDHFVFTATKDKPVRLEVFARRFGTVLRSQLDSQLDVMTLDGKILASNDDLNGKDAGIVFTPPTDGDFVVRVRDLNNKGGEGSSTIWMRLRRPDFTIKCDPAKAMIGAAREPRGSLVARQRLRRPGEGRGEGVAGRRECQPADNPREHDAGFARRLGGRGREDRRERGSCDRHRRGR